VAHPGRGDGESGEPGTLLNLPLKLSADRPIRVT
jgi:hypothetical protein